MLEYEYLNKLNTIVEYKTTVTSLLFTHIVSTEQIRKDTRDRKDTRGA